MAEEKSTTQLAIGRRRRTPLKKGTTLKTEVPPAENPSPSAIEDSTDHYGHGEGYITPRQKRRGSARAGRQLKKTKVSKEAPEIAVAEGGPVADPMEVHKAGIGEPLPLIKKHHTKKYIGAHLSIQGGLWKSVVHAVQIGARAFALFLRSQRSWSSKPLEGAVAERFHQTCIEHSFSPEFILPHSPYLMNLGSPRPDVYEKSRAMLVEELDRCLQLGLTLYNLHPGSRVGVISVDECLDRIADSLNYAHGQVKGVITVLENMSCQGTTVGGRFEELRGIIDRVTDKSRMGVCLDTCHAFAAGHNLSQKAGLEDMLKKFSEVVGLHYLKALHINDSKGTLGCHLDRHENIGRGHIGLEGFRNILNEPRFDGLPMILETPDMGQGDEHAAEIQLLYSLCEEGGKAQEEVKEEAT